MKKNISKIIAVILALVLTAALIPAFAKRLSNEQGNKNVVVSLYYNDIANKISGKTLDDFINEYKDIGVNTVSVSEENVNSMVARGDVTNIKYNVLRHKYDDESLELADIIDREAPLTNYNSQLLITKNEKTADKP